MRSNFLSWSNLKSLGSVWVIHNAEDVTEKVDHRSSDESRFTIILEWFIFFRTHSRYLFKCCCHIIEMPVYNRTSRTDCRTFGCILAVNDAKFVRLVVKAELYICWVLGVWAFKVWLDAQQLGVPLLCSFHVRSVKTDSG
jgi:hypothetical protein